MTIFLNQGKFYKQNSQIYTNNKGSSQYSYNPKFLDYREYQETLLNQINLCPDCNPASGFSYPETCTIEDPEPPTMLPISGIFIFIEETPTPTATPTVSSTPSSTPTPTASSTPSSTPTPSG